MDMKKWKEDVISSPRKKGIPVLSYPSIKLTGATVHDYVTNATVQAEGMKALADRTPSLASLSMMDLSIECEACGAKVRIPENDVPAITDEMIKTMEDAENLKVPHPGDGRTQVFIDAIKKAKSMITDRPVFAGIIGPFSMAARLMGVTDIMMQAIKDPAKVKLVTEKCTEFITNYALVYKNETGADGFVMAEPVMGLLSPKMAGEFVTPYAKEIVDKTQDNEFIVIFHNCGGGAVKMAKEIAEIGAEGYHFGNSIKMEDILPLMPKDSLVMGNVDPAGEFCFGTSESMKKATTDILEKCHDYPNFVISSGCDIGPNAKWECIDAFYEAIDEFYTKQGV
ncbi:MAG: uroporphyrinogen decarboxylase family protein [Anaerovoracaceae bacterium]